MATVKQIFSQMRTTANSIASTYLGADITALPKDVRCGDAAELAISAVIVKALLDKGVLTAADLTNALNSGATDSWDQEPTNP